VGLPLELLYADDLILMAESEEGLRDKLVKWKSGLEAKGVKMNTGKNKVMFNCNMKDRMEEKGKWPCSMCKMEVCVNLIPCHSCKKWMHKQCSGVKRSLLKASQSFICRSCKINRMITDGLTGNTDLRMDISNGVLLEKVDKFSYLGDMLGADGRCDAAVTARVRSAWKVL